MRLVTFPQPAKEVGNVLRVDVLDLGPPGADYCRGVALEIAPVRLEGVLGEAPFYG